MLERVHLYTRSALAFRIVRAGFNIFGPLTVEHARKLKRNGVFPNTFVPREKICMRKPAGSQSARKDVLYSLLPNNAFPHKPA
jgi:hypothetical protein